MKYCGKGIIPVVFSNNTHGTWIPVSARKAPATAIPPLGALYQRCAPLPLYTFFGAPLATHTHSLCAPAVGASTPLFEIRKDTIP